MFPHCPSSSSWGCELKYNALSDWVEGYRVILFVRMWVEMCSEYCRKKNRQIVILFVRMWVEIFMRRIIWMKNLVILFVRMWVEITIRCWLPCSVRVILFVRMWVEIPLRQPNQLLQSRHPLREDVSWNDAENAKGGESISHPLREDVSWNINRWGGERMYDSHPLREDVSWNLEEYGVNHRCSNMVLLVRRWIEISLIFFLSFARRSHYYTLFNLNIKLNYRNLRGNFYMCS